MMPCRVEAGAVGCCSASHTSLQHALLSFAFFFSRILSTAPIGDCWEVMCGVRLRTQNKGNLKPKNQKVRLTQASKKSRKEMSGNMIE